MKTLPEVIVKLFWTLKLYPAGTVPLFMLLLLTFMNRSAPLGASTVKFPNDNNPPPAWNWQLKPFVIIDVFCVETPSPICKVWFKPVA